MKNYDFNAEYIMRYYNEKFHFDMACYFVIPGWESLNKNNTYEVKEDTILKDLYQRGDSAFSGEPAVYMGAGPWYSSAQNYIFSGMFAYMYITQKCIHHVCGEEVAHIFCKKFNFPILRDVQHPESFDIVAALKEADLAPVKSEAEVYMDMLFEVYLFMRELTKDFIETFDSRLNGEISANINQYIKELMRWTMKTTDEKFSFYGLTMRKEYMPKESPYGCKYFLIKSITELVNRYGSFTLNGIVEKIKEQNPKVRTRFDSFDAPLVLNYKDAKFIKSYDEIMAKRDLFYEPTEMDYKQNDLYNELINTLWADEKISIENKVGIKDCNGRIIVPVIYDSVLCNNRCNGYFADELVVAVKQDGKWAIIKRGNYKEMVSGFVYDKVKMWYEFLLVCRDGKYGLYSPMGEMLMPTIMDAVHFKINEESLLYEKDGKFGVMLSNGKLSEDLFDYVDVFEDEFKVKLNGKWGFVDENGRFSTDSSKNALLLDFNATMLKGEIKTLYIRKVLLSIQDKKLWRLYNINNGYPACVYEAEDSCLQAYIAQRGNMLKKQLVSVQISQENEDITEEVVLDALKELEDKLKKHFKTDINTD